jgi:predicted RNA polymerase sigma factor
MGGESNRSGSRVKRAKPAQWGTTRATPRLPRDAYQRAIALTANAVERAELERRLGALG